MMYRCSAGNRGLMICLCAALLFSMLPFSALALTSAPLTGGNTQNGMVRVYLTSLGNPATLNLTVHGSYSVNGTAAGALSNGTKLTLKFNASSGSLLLTCNGTTSNMGSSFSLRRHESSATSGIQIAQGRVPSNLYPADLNFVVKKNGNAHKLYVIASVFMEDYLYGVLPYEMGNASGLEALKAQAVAARTYTMRAMVAAASSLYDVVDTTADQVYSGTPAGNENCKAAVDATRGIVAKNNGNFTATYYTASNGGQTESIKNAWGTTSYSYLKVKDDPYDLANPESRKISFTVRASGTQTNATLQNLLNKKAAAAYGSGAVVTGVTAITPHTPKYASPSKLYTRMDFSIQYQLNGKTDTGKITFDIFNELEGPMGMSINSGSNELWSVQSTLTGFTVSARRYGHGLGMSQRGAMYMAQQGYTYDQILAFYFEGCTRVQYTLTRSVLSPLVSGQQSQEQIVAEAPAPIENNAGQDANALRAKVTTSSGGLNLRSFASSNAAVLLIVPQNKEITILEKGDEWCKVSYNGTIGCVMTKFLTFLSVPETSSPADAPVEEEMQLGSFAARVTTQSGSLNLRSQAQSTAKVLCTIPQNTVISLSEKGTAWCKVTYNHQTGYVMTKFLTFVSDIPAVPTDTPVQEAPSGSLTARVTTVSGSLNLRYSAVATARVLGTIPQNTVITILEKGENWSKTSYDGQTGYVMNQFLTFGTAEGSEQVSPALPAGTDQTVTARVTTESGSLNLRKNANSNAVVLTTIPQYETVMVLSSGSNWCQVTYQGINGYVMTKFLTFGNQNTNESAPAAPPSSSPVMSDGLLGRVTTPSGSLNLRRKANDQATVLCTIPQNEYVTVLEKGTNWCQVTYNGTTGYVMTKFLTLIDNTSAAQENDPSAARDVSLRPLSVPINALIASTASSLNFRTGCSLDAPIMLEIPKGENVTLTQVGDDWCQVFYQGKTGYCMRKYLEFDIDE